MIEALLLFLARIAEIIFKFFLGKGFEGGVSRWVRFREASDVARQSRRELMLGKALDEALVERAMVRLYPAHDLSAYEFEHYRPTYAGRPIETGVVGRASELRMQRRIEFPVTHRVHPGVRVVDHGNLERMPEERVAAYIASFERQGKLLFNRPLYRLVDYDLGRGAWDWTFTEDEYVGWHAGIYQLRRELDDAIVKHEGDLDAMLADRARVLPKRNTILPTAILCAKPIRRFCAGGVVVTTAIYNPEFGGYCIPARKRSPRIATGAGVFGVIPQGMHQHAYHLEREANPTTSVFREVYEELFAGAEVQEGDGRLALDWIFDREKPNRPPDGMHVLLEEDRYDLICTGLGFDAVQGSYELAFLLAFHDDRAWEDFGKHINVNWEFEKKFNRPHLVSNDREQLERVLGGGRWAGSALYSLVRGLATLQDMRPDRVALEGPLGALRQA